MEKRVKRKGTVSFGQFDLQLNPGDVVTFNTVAFKATVGGITYTAPDAATFNDLLNSDCFED